MDNTKNSYKSANSFVKDYFKILSPEFPDFLYDYINTPAMKRLDKISMSCGCNYSKLYNLKFMMSNLKHSIGVALIVWHFTKDKKATLAGLFHDIATPCFKHCIDFLHGDSETQESIEDMTEYVIKSSKEIMALLKRDNIKLEEVANYHIYPIADNDTPQMSADRLEYTLSNGIFFSQVWNMKKLASYYNDLIVCENEQSIPELTFKTKELAIDFVVRAKTLWLGWFDSRDKLLMQFIADTLLRMKEKGYIKESDLYKFSERQILNKIKKCPCLEIRTAFEKFQNTTEVYESDTAVKNKYCRKIKTKKRFINPLVKNENGVARVTEISQQAKEVITEWIKFECTDYAYFDFDF